jgi:flagellin FlaB
MKKLLKNKKGMTGIETAIILIAFVIAASVFAFAVLNMGLISTQRAQEAVGAGLAQASSSLQLESLVCEASGNPMKVDNITILVKLAPGQAPVDFNQSRLTISYKNNYTYVAEVYDLTHGHFETSYDKDYSFGSDDIYSTIMVIQGNTNGVLEAGETFAIILNLNKIDSEHGRLGAYEQFLVDVIPSIGSKLTVQARVPANVEPVMTLLTGGT